MFNRLPNSAWADENLAEATGQLGKMVDLKNQSQPNPGPRADGAACTSAKRISLQQGLLPFFRSTQPVPKLDEEITDETNEPIHHDIGM